VGGDCKGVWFLFTVGGGEKGEKVVDKNNPDYLGRRWGLGTSGACRYGIALPSSLPSSQTRRLQVNTLSFQLDVSAALLTTTLLDGRA
jgi:hypothetical protein